jgi:hypothetical protein
MTKIKTKLYIFFLKISFYFYFFPLFFGGGTMAHPGSLLGLSLPMLHAIVLLKINIKKIYKRSLGHTGSLHNNYDPYL